MRRRIGIFGVNQETLALLRELMANPLLEFTGVWDVDPAAALALSRRMTPEITPYIAPLITDDLDAFLMGNFHAVIDSGSAPGFAARFPQAREHGVQVVSPLTARLLWAWETATRDRKQELLTALAEVVESVEMTVDSDELFGRMLEIAVGITGADGGSLMLLDKEKGELSIRVATGVERELWGKIRVPLGEGIAGRVAAEGRPMLVHGKADGRTFQIVRERLDVASALCVPLISDHGVLGVINLHHSTQREAFTEDDLAFMGRVARLDAQIITRAAEHEKLRDHAARYDTVRSVHELMANTNPLPDRLRRLCTLVAERVGGGIATIYLRSGEQGALCLSATSLAGGGFGGEYRVIAGQGIDGRVAQSKSPELLHAEDGSLAYACLPLIAGDELLGILAVQSGAPPPQGRAAEEMLLELGAAIAEEIAQAERETRMTVRADRVSAINESGIRMLSSNELSEVVRIATSSIAMILDADHTVLRLQDEKTRRYVIRSYFGAADGGVQERLFKLDKHVCVDVIRRRGALRVTELATHEAFADRAQGLRSLIAAPLRRDGRVIGTLAVYDKIAADRFYASAFDEADQQIFLKFIRYLERAIDGAVGLAESRQHRNFDGQTGLPNAGYLRRRIHEEISRAAGRPGALALAICRIENPGEIARGANPAEVHRVTLRVASALRAHLREFDVLGRTGASEFTILLPDPGTSPSERILALARSVADEIAKDEALNDPVRVALAFGYATHPEEGADQDALLACAAEARIRMV